MPYCYTTGTYNQHPSHYGSQYVQSLPSSANLERGEFSIQKFPPASIDFLNWDDFLTTPSTGSVAQVSTTLPIQTNSLSAATLMPPSYLDIVANSSRVLPVAAPVPVPHAALTKAALRTMMSFDNKDKENFAHNNNSAGGSETDARTRIDFDNHGLRSNRQSAMNCNVLVNSGNSNQTSTGVTGRSKLVIRPISPSTLMALTEPCLMAWCTPSDESLTEPGLSAYLPLQSSNYNNLVDKKNKTVFNAWGY